jgi:hypothetical protein
MFILPDVNGHNLYFQTQPLITQVVNKEEHTSDANWGDWLNRVRNEQIKFEVRWVIIRDGIRNDGLDYGLIKTAIGSETGLNNSRYGIVQVPYAALPNKLPPTPLGPPPGMTTDSILRSEVRVFIINPAKVYWLSYSKDPRILDALITLLDDPDRAWAAHVVLSKMLGITGLSSRIDQITPHQWWELEGKTRKAQQAWTQYLQKVKSSMVWSPAGGYYKHRAPDGRFIL